FLQAFDHGGHDPGGGGNILFDAEIPDHQHLVAVLVGVVTHGPQDDAGHPVLGRDLADGGALHLDAVGVAGGFDLPLGLGVPHEAVAGGDPPRDGLDPRLGAGRLGGGDQGGVPGVFVQVGRVLVQHIHVRVVVEDGLADHHVPDADLAGHVAGDAREDDLLGAVFRDEDLGGGGGVGLAHAGAADHRLAARQAAAVVADPAVFLHRHLGQAGAELIHFFGHGAHDSDDHSVLLTH